MQYVKMFVVFMKISIFINRNKIIVRNLLNLLQMKFIANNKFYFKFENNYIIKFENIIIP